MTGLEFAPLTFIIACVTFTFYIRAKAAEKCAIRWKSLAKEQEKLIKDLGNAFQTQGDALERLMKATDRFSAG